MFYSNKNRSGVGARHVGNDRVRKTNKQTFPNKQSPTRVANDTKINNISVTARWKDGSKTECAVPRLSLVLEDGSGERVTVAADKSQFDGSSVPAGRRPKQTRGQTNGIRKRVSGSRLRSNCDENSGLCQVLAPSNIDRSEKVRDYIVWRSVEGRHASQRHGGDHDPSTTVQKKYSPCVHREGKSVLCNITHGGNLQQSSKGSKVETRINSQSCHPLQSLTHKPLNRSDGNIRLNGNTQNSNGSRCLSKNGLLEKKGKYTISGIENGNSVSPVVEKGRSPGVCGNTNRSSCYKKSGSGEKKMEKIFPNHSSNLACGMECGEQTVGKTKRRLKASKIAVLSSKSSGQRKSNTSQRQEGRDAITVNKSPQSDRRVVSGLSSDSASLPGSLLEAEITDLDRNGTGCKASRRREIGDGERCADRAGNITGLSEGKVLHYREVPIQGRGVVGVDEHTFTETTRGNTAGGQTTPGADDNNAQHAPRADSVQPSRKICQRLRRSKVIVRDSRNARRKKEIADYCVVRQDGVSAEVSAARDHGMITVSESPVCVVQSDTISELTLNNGESTVYDSSTKLSQSSTIIPGNNSHTDCNSDSEHNYADHGTGQLCGEASDIHLNVEDSFHGNACFSNNEREEDAIAETNGFRVCEITEKTSSNEVKASRRQKQISSIPSYQGPRKHGKTTSLKDKKLLKRGKDFTNAKTGPDEIRCGESVVKNSRYDSQVPFVSANVSNAGSKSLNHKTVLAEAFESERKTFSADEYKHTDVRIPEKTELLLISDRVSYLVSAPEGITCTQTDTTPPAAADDVICKSHAPENLAGTDAEEKSLEASGEKIPQGSLSLGDKKRKGVSSTGERLLGLHSAHVEYLLSGQYSSDVDIGLAIKHVGDIDSKVNQDVTHCNLNLNTNDTVQNVGNYGDNSSSVDYDNGCGITDDNAHVCDNNGGGGHARCVMDQSALECVADQTSGMATKSSGPLTGKNMIPSKHKGERLKRQIGQASLEINLAEKGEGCSGAQLPDSAPGRRKHDSASTSRLMRPTISSAIRSSPEMAKKLIPKARSPTSPDYMFSPPMERKNREHKKKETTVKVKSKPVSGVIVTHKPPLDKATCDKLSNSPRSSVSSTDASIRSGIAEKVSEITDSQSNHKHRKGANKTKTSSVSTCTHQSASADSSVGKSKRCGTVKAGEPSESEVEGRDVLIPNRQSGVQKGKSVVKDGHGSDSVTSVSETEVCKVDKSDKVEHRDVKIEKTRRNVETYESGVESAMDTNRSSSERECRNKQNIDRGSSSSPISNDNSHNDCAAKNGRAKVTRNAQRTKIGEPTLKSNPPDVKYVGKKSVPASAKIDRGQKPGGNVLSEKKKDSSATLSESETVEKGSMSDSVQRGGSISPTSSVTSVVSKSGQSNTKQSKSLNNNSRNLKIERVPSRVSLNGHTQKRTENKSTVAKPAVSEDCFQKDKTKTFKKGPSVPDLKKAEVQKRKAGPKHKVPSSGQSNTQQSHSERSTSNSPRSSVVDDDTDGIQSLSSAVSKPNKPASRLPKASRLPSASTTQNKAPAKTEKVGVTAEKLVKSRPSRQNSQGALNKSRKTAKGDNSSETNILHSKDAICDVKNDSKPTSKRKNLKENMNRKQREMSPMYHPTDTDLSEYSAVEDVIPSISDYDMDKTEDIGGKSHGPSPTRDTTIPKTDQSESKKMRNAPKSLTSPKVESKKIHQTKSYSKKISPSSPSFNSRTSPGSPKTEVKKSPTSPLSAKSGSSGSQKSPKVESKLKVDLKLPKKSGPKKPQRNLRNLSSLTTLEHRYTAEKLELMRLKIPAEMDFSDVSRPSTREGSVDSRFDDDRWSICSDISSISRASSVSMSSGIRPRGSKVPTRMTVPSSRVKIPTSRLTSQNSATKMQPGVKSINAVSSLTKSGLESKPAKGKEFSTKKSSVPAARKSGPGSKKNSPEEEKSFTKDEGVEKLKPESTVSVPLKDRTMLNNDNISRSSICSEWLKGSTPLIQTNVNNETVDQFDPESMVMNSSEDGSKGNFFANASEPLIEKSTESRTSQDKNNFSLMRSSTLTACSRGEKIVSDSGLPAEPVQDCASKVRNVNSTSDTSKQGLHSQGETDTYYNEEAMVERQYGAISPADQVIITATANEGQGGDIPSNEIINSRNATNLISEQTDSILSVKQTQADREWNLFSHMGDSLYSDNLCEVTEETENLSSAADGQTNQEQLPAASVTSALYTPPLPREHCTLSPHADSNSAERGSSDNIYRHSVGSEYTNNKHLHLREGGAHEEIPHPIELTTTPNTSGWSSYDIENSEMEKPDMINACEDRGGFLGECDGMLSKLSRVKEIKTEGRVDIQTGVPMAEPGMREAGLSLAEEFMGCDKNGEDFERQFDKNDKTSINKPLHISGVSDKTERGCTTKTAGSGFHVDYDSSLAQEDFDTFEPETETAVAGAAQGRYGRMISGDTRSGSSHRLEKVQGLGAAHRSGFNSGDVDRSTEGQNTGDTAADGRHREQTAKQQGGCQLDDVADEDRIKYVSSEEGKPGFINKLLNDLDISSDEACEFRDRVMDSHEISDLKSHGENNSYITPLTGYYASVPHPDSKVTPSNAKSDDKTKPTTLLVEEHHASYQQISEKSTIVVLSPGTQRSSEVMPSTDQSGTVLATQTLQKAAGIEIQVNYNGVGNAPVCRDGNSTDKGPSRKCDSQTLGRIQSGRGDKLSSPPPGARLVIDKRNLYPDGYDENMPIQRKILLNTDSLKSKDPVCASKLVMKDAKVSGDARINTGAGNTQMPPVHTSKVVIKDSEMPGPSENVNNQPSNIKLKVTMSKFESQKDGAGKPTSRLQTYKPVHKSEFLKQSSVRKSLASRAQQKAISARFSQDSGSVKVNKAKESVSVLMKPQSQSESVKTPRKEHTQSPVPHVSSIEFSLKKDSPDNQRLCASVPDELVTSSSDGESSLEISVENCETDNTTSRSEEINVTSYVTSKDSDSQESGSETGGASSGTQRVGNEEIGENRVENVEISGSFGERKEESAVTNTANSLMADDNVPVADVSLPLDTLQADAISRKAAATDRQDTDFCIKDDENVQLGNNYSSNMVRQKAGKSTKIPPTVSPKPKVSVTADGKIDLSYGESTQQLNKVGDKTDTKVILSEHNTENLSDSSSRNEMGFEPQTVDLVSSDSEMCEIESECQADVSAISEGSTTESQGNDVDFMPITLQSDSIVDKFENDHTAIPTQTVMTSVAPPLKSIEVCSFDKSPELSSPRCPNETVSKQGLKRSTGTTSLQRWQTVKNKFLGKPGTKVSKEKVNIVPSAHGSVEKTIEEFEVCLDKKLNTDRSKDKSDDKFVDCSRVSEIRRTLSERLAKSPVPETPPATPSPSPTRKYKWIRGEGGIWMKKFLSDSGESGSEAEDYGRENQDDIPAKLLPVNRREANIDRESSSESEYKPAKEGGRHLHKDTGVDNEMETSSSEVEDVDINNHWIKMDTTVKTQDNVIQQDLEPTNETEGVCTEKVDFEAIMQHFNNRVALSASDGEKVRGTSVERKSETRTEEIRKEIESCDKSDLESNEEISLILHSSDNHSTGGVRPGDTDSGKCDSVLSGVNDVIDTCHVFGQVAMETDLNVNERTCHQNDVLDKISKIDSCKTLDSEIYRSENVLSVICRLEENTVVNKSDHTSDDIQNQQQHIPYPNEKEMRSLDREIGYNILGADGQTGANLGTGNLEHNCVNIGQSDGGRTKVYDNTSRGQCGYDNIGTRVVCDENVGSESSPSSDSNVRTYFKQETSAPMKENVGKIDSGICVESELLDREIITNSENCSDGRDYTVCAGVEQTPNCDQNVDITTDKLFQSVCNKIEEGLPPACNTDREIQAYHESISQIVHQRQVDSTHSFSSQTLTISRSESSGSINLNDEKTWTHVDQEVVRSEMREKFIPIEASPILQKKCLESNSTFESEDQISLSAAESSENVSLFPACVSSAGSVTDRGRHYLEQDFSERGDTESELSSYCGYDTADTTICDDDLDTTVTDDDPDDLCELVINEDLDDTVVGAEAYDGGVDLHVQGDAYATPVNVDPQRQSDMASSPCRGGVRRYSYAGSTGRSSATSGSSSTEMSDSGYWSTRKAFWEKDSHELLAEISELEESFEAVEGTDTELQRSASASPVKGSEQQGGTTPRRLRRKKSGRRSLSLPSGTLSYGDVKITYVDGHFIAEPPDDPEDTKPKSYDRSNRDSISSGGLQATSNESIAESSGNEDTLSIVSDLGLREELLAWLNQHLVESDVFYNQSLDFNCNHVGSDSSTHSSQSSLAMIPASSTLPRRTGRDNDGNRPVSVDEIQLFRNAYFQEQFESKLNEGQGHSQTYRDQVNQDSLLSDPRNGRRRLSVQDDKSERSRSKSPNFFQRMLSKRKSFSEKVAKVPEDGAPRKDTSIVRRMSLKSLFKRKTRKGSDEPDSPPIAAFLKDEDIGAVSSLPNSPFVSKRVHRVQTDPQIQIRRTVPTVNTSDDQPSLTVPPQNQSTNPPRAGLTRPDVPPRRRQSSSSMKQGSVTDRSSGEYSLCDYDMGSEDVLTPRSVSPSVVDTEHDSTKQHSGKLVRGEITSNSNDSGIQHDAVLLSSSESLKVSPDSSAPVSIAVKLRKTPSPKQERPKSDITVRWADLLEQVRETDVTYRKDGQQLRKRPRPKSDLEDILFVDEGVDEDDDDVDDVDVIVADPHGRSRSVSDLKNAGISEKGGGSTLLSESMRAFGSIGNLRPSDSLRSLRLVDGFQVELRRSSQDVRVVSAKLVKSRRAPYIAEGPWGRHIQGVPGIPATMAFNTRSKRVMSTPHPIKNRSDKTHSQPRRKAPVMVRSHSMPENLDKLHRKKNFLSLIGSDNQSLYSQRSGGDDSSDESEYSVEFTLHDKCPSTRSSQSALATLDETQEEETMTYAEALWDHVTMDPDELGFRAGDQIRVTDMMDKDWWFGYTEQHRGWFPAAFVRLWVNQERFEDMMIHDTEETPKIRNHGVNTDQGRANVVNEIIHAEREYVKHLRDVVEGYLKQAKKRPEMFPEEKISIIFGNIEEIYTFANRFLASLEKAFNTELPHLSAVGQVFLLHSQSFEIYSDYCNNHPGSGEEVKELYRNKKYRHFFEACRLLQEMIEIPLEGFLLTPVQKICKYHLQLNELLKYTPPDHVDYQYARAALDSMKKIATLINERKRKMESIEKIATWQASVDDWEGDDILQHSSELIYSGELHKINSSGWSQERYFFLFDHQLVYCKKDLLKKNGFCYKGRIDLDHSEVIPLNDGKDAQYNVTVRHSWKVHDTMRDKWYLLVAKSEQVKKRWLKAFEDERKRVKDDQENNFNIPVHLKQTAINNLKQKSHLGKPKAKRKAARSTSLRQAKKPDSTYPVSIQATLPRKKQQDSLGDINQSKKLTWFFLGQGKKK